MPTIAPFLMFDGQAEAALRFYASVFPGARVTGLARRDGSGSGVPGTVRHATLTIGDQSLMCVDSAVAHAFGFTPAMSLHVTCDTADEVDRLFSRLAEGGQVFMPLDRYPFSARYGWCSDRFGVSWQVTVRDG